QFALPRVVFVTAPLTLLRVAELATQAGIPDGVFNVVTGSGAGCGAALTAHPQVAKVSFTGSTATGKQIARVAADRLTRVTLELGGGFGPQLLGQT
ncbi:aldehyde dehydrogenase family protein, partial [Klebsiella pneumoniae]|uniref:aldehyde dehydrogenase family protein n=1 Tax=Klebsiella pneumoniae TaxID=573 RepID=UPI002109183F